MELTKQILSKGDLIEDERRVSEMNRYQKLLDSNPEKEQIIKQGFRDRGFGDWVTYNLKRGISTVRAPHDKVMDELVEKYNLCE